MITTKNISAVQPIEKAASTLIREYVWPDGTPVAVIKGGVIYHVRSDHIGRPVLATDGTATVVWSASYLPFGGVHVTSGTPMDLRFPGQWFQSESGLHQNWMRDYDPTTRRYIEADPLGLADGPSVYGYALQNPGRYTDPTGEFVPLLILAAITIGGYIVEQQLEECGCDTDLAFERYAGLGAAAGYFGASKTKSTRPFGSSKFSSYHSRRQDRFYRGMSRKDAKNARRSARRAGRRIANRLPGMGAGFLIYDSVRLGKCKGLF